MVARNYDAEIAEAEAKVLTAEAALKAKQNDTAFMEKLAAAKARLEAANAKATEASDKVEARRTAVLLEKQILVRTGDGLVRNPDLVGALLVEANLSKDEVENMKSPNTIPPFRGHRWNSPIDTMVGQMSMNAFNRDAEAKRLTQEYRAADDERSRASNDHWYLEREMTQVVDNLEAAKHELARAKNIKEEARLTAEARAAERAERKARGPDPDAAARKANEARLANGKQVLHEIYTGKRPFVWPRNATPTADEKLAILREQWEKGYTVEGEVKAENGALLVSLSKNGGLGRVDEYALHRYFQLNGEWQVSVDYKGNDKVETRE